MNIPTLATSIIDFITPAIIIILIFTVPVILSKCWNGEFFCNHDTSTQEIGSKESNDISENNSNRIKISNKNASICTYCGGIKDSNGTCSYCGLSK